MAAQGALVRLPRRECSSSPARSAHLGATNIPQAPTVCCQPRVTGRADAVPPLSRGSLAGLHGGTRAGQLTPPPWGSGRRRRCAALLGKERGGFLADTSTPPAASSSMLGAGCPHPEGPQPAPSALKGSCRPVHEAGLGRAGLGASLRSGPEKKRWGSAGQPAAPNVSRRPEASGPGAAARSQVINTAQEAPVTRCRLASTSRSRG